MTLIQPLKAYSYFLEAWCLLALSRLLLLFVPFRHLAQVTNITHSENTKNTVNQSEFCREITEAIGRASRYSPWRTACFEQALAARFMLKKRDQRTTLYFGVYKSDNHFFAHAWLKCGHTIVTGGSSVERYKVISEFH